MSTSTCGGLGKIDDTESNCTVEGSTLGCSWYEYGIEQILANSVANVMILTTTKLKVVPLAIELIRSYITVTVPGMLVLSK